ncbi:hypothetical protein [Pseudomonas silesiensis]|uniref:hypothetical protein n=1 Tax=Pseudomonas silesiensis TaxID=1853130 RepID=UPI0030DBB247
MGEPWGTARVRIGGYRRILRLPTLTLKQAARIGRAVDRLQDYLEGAVRDNIEAVLIAWAILDQQEVALWAHL